ncbi:hypothetical protein ACFYUV_34615 [Nonomuraea sp. NPDC003560]|uniref:hypothetical protein n=1 Tax=Nonomuraea sp. NPDC003560 TaxID=3364341 RepID=UPI003688FF5C
MGTVLDEVTEDSWLRGHFKDAEWVAEYLDAVARTHALPAGFTAGTGFEVAVTCSGTRNAMFDYGRLILADAPRTASPTVIAPAPGWDYRGCSPGWVSG